MLYYIVELYEKEVDLYHTVLVKEDVLESFIVNCDKVTYKIVNITGVGDIKVEYKDYLKTPDGLELGKPKEDSDVSK